MGQTYRIITETQDFMRQQGWQLTHDGEPAPEMVPLLIGFVLGTERRLEPRSGLLTTRLHNALENLHQWHLGNRGSKAGSDWESLVNAVEDAYRESKG